MNRMKFFVVILIILFFANMLVAAETQDLDKLYQKKLEYKKEVYEKTLKFLQENPDAPNAARLYFNLGEMSTEIDVNKPAKTAYYYKKVLDIDPNFPSKDIVLYNLAFFSFEAAKKKIAEGRARNRSLMINWPDSLRLNESMPEVKRAIGAYKIIINYYPESQYHSEALYRLGALYFELALDAREPMAYYDKAIKYFNILAQKAGDPLQNHAIFQRGWTYFTSGKYDEAIKDFTHILKVMKRDSLSEHKSYFEDDAIENIAYSLIEFDGTNFTQYSNAAKKLNEIFSNFVSKDYSKKIILDAIRLKLKYYAPMQAIDLYNALIALYPLDIDNPCYNDSIIAIYKRYPKRTRNNEDPKKLIVKEYERITKSYSPESEWFKANKDKDISKQLNIIFYAYNFIEKRYYNNFAKKQTLENYNKYRKLVQSYITLANLTGKNLSDKQKVVRQRLIEAALNLAAKTHKPEYYFTAISSIKDYIRTYGHDDKYFEYNKNLFLITENLYQSLKDSVKVKTFVDTTINVVMDSLALDSLLVQASRDYENVLEDSLNPLSNDKKNKELARIILLRADILRQQNKMDYAISDYKKVLTIPKIDKNMKQTVLSTLAYIYQSLGDFAEAEKYYRDAAAISSKKQKANLENNILATIKSSAELNLQRGDFEKSAQEYLRLAEELKEKDPKQSVAYTVKAIDVYKKAGEFQKAIDLFVKIANSKKDKIEVLAALKGAWTIADSSLKDINQTIALKKSFINKYPSSNEAYILRLQLIELYDKGPLADKEKAAQMYLQLFDDAYNKKIDIGEDKPEDIFLNALRIYEELGNEDKIIEYTYKFVSYFPKNPVNEKLLSKVAIILDNRSDVDGMLAFEKKFPNHPSSIDLLKRVAFIYKTRGEESKYEDIARYIHKKDPNIDLLTEIAAQKLKDIKTEIDSLFIAGDYEQMNKRIQDFKNIHAKYKKDNIKLDLKPVYERFDYYKNYIAFHKKYQDFLSKVKKQILDKTPNQLIKVNKLTTWKRHLYSGKKRLRNLMVLCNKYEKKFLQLLKEGKDYDLTDDEVMEGLSTIGKIYDYSTDVVIKQVEKYTNVSNELNNEMWKNNPLLQKTTKNKIRTIAKNYSIKFLTKAIKYYGNVYTIYKEKKGYNNDITAYAEKRLKDLGYLKPKVYEYYYTDANWKINKEKINDYTIDKDIDSLWTFTKTTGDKVLDNADIIDLPDFITSYMIKNLHFDIEPELLEISYLHNLPIKIYVNGIKADLAPSIIDTLSVNGKDVLVYKQKAVKGLTQGDNEILFKISPDSDNNIFAANIKVQYDKEKLEYFRTTKSEVVLTNLSWYSNKGNINPETINDLSGWGPVGKGFLQYFKPQLYGLGESKSMDIWSVDIDTTKVQTRYFAKEIYIPNTVIKANAIFAAQKLSSLWVNGKPVYKDKGLLFDKSLQQALPITTEIPLKKGKNIILIKVVGGPHFKGLIGEINYTYKINNDQAENKTEEQNNNETDIADKQNTTSVQQEENINQTETKPDKTDTETKNAESVQDTTKNEDTSAQKDVKEDESKSNLNFDTLKNKIVSDYTWFTLKGIFDYIIPEEDTLWTLVGKSFVKIDANPFKNDNAFPVWYPESTKDDSVDVYFIKSFDNPTDNTSGILKVYSSYPVSIWLNNVKIADNLDASKDIKEINVNGLVKGNNTVFVRVHKSKVKSKEEFFLFDLRF